MRFLLNSLATTLLLALPLAAQAQSAPTKGQLFTADNKNIQYTGRIDFADAKKPRFWAPGVYITTRFEGSSCAVLVNDEVLGGGNHNYLELVLDGKPSRIQLTGKENTVPVASNLAAGPHTLTVCKNTESNIGYLEFVGVRCAKLLPPSARAAHRIEFIGNSITCGTGSDQSVVPCGKGKWHDQHNAYMAYGPTTARALGAQWQLTAVSGIGLMHSCCNMTLVMPQVFDKINLRENAIAWDFSRYQPDVVTICLGQNDGIQDSTTFCGNYVTFLNTMRQHYPKAQLVCLTSPMADAKLTAVLRRYLTGIVAHQNAAGDAAVHKFFFSRSYNSGCDNHPSLAEHQLIAAELTAYLKNTLHW
ncbi:MAG: SGNH/GDSL hydrolase family protein [Janthinobacterium lividum]